MTSQEALELLLSEKRLTPFTRAASGNIARAEELYRWNNRLSGALHAQIGLFEVITRNALDRGLRAWCLQRFGTRSWTSRDLPANEIHVLISRQLADARKNAAKAARNRPPSASTEERETHSRRCCCPTDTRKLGFPARSFPSSSDEPKETGSGCIAMGECVHSYVSAFKTYSSTSRTFHSS